MKIRISNSLPNVKKIALDFIPEFIAVLVALLLTGWLQDSSDKDFINKSISSIHNDCKTNIKLIQEQEKHLKCQLDTFRRYVDDSNKKIIDIVRRNGGIMTETMTNSGWKILERSMLVSKMDYDMLSLLSYLDAKYDYMDFSIKGMANLLYSNVNSASSNDKRTLIVLLNDIKNISSDIEEKLVKLDSIIIREYPELVER